MKNKLKYIVTTIVILFIFTLISIYLSNRTSLTNITTNEYRELLQNDEEKLVYIGRPTCPGCEEILPEIEAIAETMDEDIYYYNTDKAKKKDFDDFEVFKKEIDLQYVPIIIRYKGEEEGGRYEYKEYTDSHNSLVQFIKGSD